MYVCMYVCIYVWMHVCMYVCMYELHAVARTQFNKFASILRASNLPPLGTNSMQRVCSCLSHMRRQTKQVLMHFAYLEFAVPVDELHADVCSCMLDMRNKNTNLMQDALLEFAVR